jgi:carbamoyl-phosphate synthase large subunit
MRPNILITSAGRRGKLLAIFQQELDRLIPGAHVFAADSRPETSVACRMAHRSFAVPRASDPRYAEQLIDLCVAHDVGLIVPTIDPELAVLAAYRDAFAAADVAAAVSGPEFISITRDKRLTAEWFAQNGIATPRVVEPRLATPFPLFAKPFDGSSSQQTRIIEQPGDLTPALLADQRMMFVEFLSPAEHDEYTLDMYYCRESVLRCCVPRLRIETRAGEVSKSRTCRTSALEPLRATLSHLAGARGCITLQVFVHRVRQEVYGIEVNARFGGGFPLSYDAGANYPRWLVQEYLLGQRVENFDGWEDNLTMLRYDDHVLVRNAAA